MARKSKKKTGQKRVETSADEPIPTVDDLEQSLDSVMNADGTDESVKEEAREFFEDGSKVEDAEVLSPIDDYLETSEAEGVASIDDADPAFAESSAAPTPAPAQSGGGFFPLLIGGLVAGGIGYGISYFQWANQGSLDSAIAQQADMISALEEKIAALPAPTDISPLEGQVAEVAASVGMIDTAVSDLGAQFADATDRIVELERRPNADGTLADTALAAFEGDIQVLRDQLMTQQEEMQTMVASASEQLQATRDEAISIEENAVATARKATARTVLAQVQSAMDTGAPLGALLTDLGGALEDPIPDALTAVSDGAPTLAMLQETYPEQARAALSIARAEGVSGEDTSGFGSFLRNQLDMRSVEPQEGDSADAVLSRAQASVKTGQLNDALAEIAGLPEVVRGALADWVGQAELRAAALDAVASLSDTLNIN